MIMKIVCVNEKIIIYLYKENIIMDDIIILNSQIKRLFITLIKKYNLDLWGSSKVYIYHNDIYGSILEIERICSDEYNNKIIDLKLILNKNVDFYIEINDNIYIIDNNCNYVVKDNKFYININELDDVYKYIECGKIVYKL